MPKKTAYAKPDKSARTPSKIRAAEARSNAAIKKAPAPAPVPAAPRTGQRRR